MKYKRLVLILLAMMGSVYAMAQVMPLRKVGSEKIKPVKIYKRHQLADISADGRYILFNLVGRSKNEMKIIEAESDKEVSRKNKLLSSARFTLSPNDIFYIEHDQYKIWNFKKGVTKVCVKNIRESVLKDVKGFDEPTLSLGILKFLDEKEAFGTVPYSFYLDGKKKISELLVKLKLPSCKLEVLGDVYEPNLVESLRYKSFSGIEFTADKRQVLYILGGKKIIVRNISTFEIEKEFTVAPLAPLYLSYFFVPDGRHLILKAEDFTSDKSRHLLLIYDAKTFREMRRIEVTDDDSISISPNGRFAAVGYRTVEEGGVSYLFRYFSRIVEQGHIDLFDLRTGKKVATMSHKKMGERPNTPWMWYISRTQFTPDGRYLLTSSHRDTYVWDVAALTSNASLTSVQDKQGSTVK